MMSRRHFIVVFLFLTLLGGSGMLFAQAEVEGFTLLTGDARVAQYPGPVQKV